MFCYNHDNVSAIGICKACGKALCHNCKDLVENQISCHSACAERIIKHKKLSDKSMKLYNLDGKNKSWTSTTAITMFLMSCPFLACVIYDYVTTEKVNAFSFTVGIVFLLSSFLYYKSNKNSGIKL
jgi:hypothetical protein